MAGGGSTQGVGSGACCYHDASGAVVCAIMSSVECQQVFRGVYQGDGTRCDPSPCGQVPSGACCYVDATGPHCAVLFALECELYQGQYQGDGTSCNPNPCAPAEGACCYRDAVGQWACAIVTATVCQAQYGGLYQGDGSNCGPPLPCQSPEPNGACCYGDPAGGVQCVVVSAYECDTIYHGVYHGNGSNCGPPDPCTELGACCFFVAGAVQCVETTAADCQATYQGTFQGVGTQCTSQGGCPGGATGACCYGSPALCVVATQDDCVSIYGGTYQGDNSACDPNPCLPPGAGACCVTSSSGGGVCVTATPTECEQLGGTFHGVGSTCTPTLCGTSTKCDCPGRCDNHTPAFTDPAFATFTGPVAVCTHYDPFVTNNAVVIVDLQNKGSAPLNTNWNTTTLYSPNLWSHANLGTVFGVTVDGSGNIYVTASTSYYTHQTGIGGWGTVYKIDTSSGVPSVFANLPNTGPGLGNITFDSVRNQFFVTNFEDGRIYRLDMAGNCLSTFNHATGLIGGCAADPNDTPGFVPLGARPWGVSVWNNRVYYGVWTEDSGRPSATASNTIWSIGLAGANFSGAAQLEITVPILGPGHIHSNPPSDISFSRTGCMLISERSMYLDDAPTAHASRVLEYRQVGPAWWPSAVSFQVGVISGGANSSGGADYDKDGDVWATGDALQFSPQVIYGMQGLPCNGGGVAQSILVDLNGNLTFQDKTLLGDVEVTCLDLTGACCYQTIDGTFCVVTTAADCAQVWHGVYQGDNTSCTPNPCPVTGACCYQGPDGPTCVIATATDCDQVYHGTYLGDNTMCAPNPCLPTGACCYQGAAGPTCIIVTQADCVNIYQGTYLGDNTTCTPNPCIPTGACCVKDDGGNSICVTATQSECVELLHGIYQGDNTVCGPDTCPDNTPCDCVSGCDSHTPDYEDPAFAPFIGSSVVATQFDPLNSNRVVVVVDLSGKGSAPLNTHWGTPRYSHPSWDPNNLGTVFGVTVDGGGNIYVTASTSYATHLAASGGWGGVYKLDAGTGAISVFASLPNTGPGLGNITFDAANGQFFVSNFEDGRIYRLSATGACLSTFSHATGLIGGCAADPNDAAGFVPLGQRPWGLAVYNNRLYYGLWVEDMGRPNPTAYNEVWSIALAGGNFSGAPQLEISLPDVPLSNWSSPPSELNFSRTGCMLIAERSMYLDDQPSAHASRVLEYRKIAGLWWPSPVTFDVGVFNGTNSAGGADYDEDGDVWVTGDALQFGPQYIYGVQGLPCTGGDPNNSILVDLNGVFTVSDKTWIGALKTTCNARCTPPPKRMVAWFPFDETSGSTALEIAWGNNGTYSGTASIPGVVAAARRFNGTTNFVRVPNAPQINFGQGNFSFDAWVRSNATSGVQVILDKRANPPRGYSFYLFNGRPGMQLADGAGFINYAPLVSIADGTWHHVAVTVNRTSSTGIKFYIDGAFVQAFDPTPWPGNISNPNRLWIGVREPLLGGGGNFPGDLDEIELFRRELSAAEVQRLYQAGQAGKCKERAYLPKVTSYCWYENVKTVPFTIFNDSPSAYTHNWWLAGDPSCGIAWPAGAFTPSGVAGAPIGGNASFTWNVNIAKPPGLGTACYDATVSSSMPTTFGTSATVTAAPWKWCFWWADPVPVTGVVFVPPAGTAVVAFGVTNSDTQPATLTYQLVARARDGDPNVVVRLNGLPPGEPVLGSIPVAPGATELIPVEVSFDEPEPFDFTDIVLEAEDGRQMVPVASVGVRSEVIPAPPVCPGDCNCDGNVGFQDIDYFVAAIPSNEAAWRAMFAPGTPDCTFANCDVNGDGNVGFDDIDPFVGLIPSTCP